MSFNISSLADAAGAMKPSTEPQPPPAQPQPQPQTAIDQSNALLNPAALTGLPQQTYIPLTALAHTIGSSSYTGPQYQPGSLPASINPLLLGATNSATAQSLLRNPLMHLNASKPNMYAPSATASASMHAHHHAAAALAAAQQQQQQQQQQQRPSPNMPTLRSRETRSGSSHNPSASPPPASTTSSSKKRGVPRSTSNTSISSTNSSKLNLLEKLATDINSQAIAIEPTAEAVEEDIVTDMADDADIAAESSSSIIIPEEVTKQEVVRCVCGKIHIEPTAATAEEQGSDEAATVTNDNVSDAVVQCEGCLVWQHARCVGLTSLEHIPAEYFCELCDPQNTIHTTRKKYEDMLKRLSSRAAIKTEPADSTDSPTQAQPMSTSSSNSTPNKRGRDAMDTGTPTNTNNNNGTTHDDPKKTKTQSSNATAMQESPSNVNGTT